jgi:hypothetical protein
MTLFIDQIPVVIDSPFATASDVLDQATRQTGVWMRNHRLYTEDGRSLPRLRRMDWTPLRRLMARAED